MLTDHQDAYGHGVMDHVRHGHSVEIVERDDGFIDVSAGAPVYLAESDAWREIERTAMEHVHGRVLDVGCGVGRFALYLQERGHVVTGIDISPLAIQICKERGLLDARLLSITQTGRDLGMYDCIIMMGNNFGLFGGPKRGRWLLRRWRAMTSPMARIVAQTTDPYETTDPLHLAYHQANRERGRLGGQLRIRVRYRAYCSPWFDYWLASPDEVLDLVAGTGWRVEQLIHDNRSPQYLVVLAKEDAV